MEDPLFSPGTILPVRLLHRLDRLHDARVAVLTAPGGFNKSELVRTWLKLDPVRDETSIIVLILPEREIHAVTPLRDALASSDPDMPCHVFLDNHDLLQDSTVLNEVLDVIEAHPHARLILAGHTRPNVPLAGLQMRGMLVEITRDELLYTQEEIEEILRTHGDPEFKTRDLLMGRYHGWPIVYELLCSTGISLANADTMIASIEGYIEEEVLGEISPEDRDFLTRLSLINDFTPAHAAFITGRRDAVSTLMRLNAQGIPMRWNANNEIFICSGLQMLLSRKLEQQHPELLAECNRRQAEWLQRQGDVAAALDYAITANDDKLTYDLVYASLCKGSLGMVAPLEIDLDDLLPRLPRSFNVDIIRTVIGMLRTPGAQPIGAIASIRAALPEQLTYADRTRFYGASMFCARWSGGAEERSNLDEAVTFALELLQHPEADVAPVERALLWTEAGLVMLYNGEATRSLVLFKAALTAAQIASLPWLTAWVLSALSLAHALDGSAATAKRIGEESILINDRLGLKSPALIVLTLYALAVCALSTGDLVQARAQLDRYAAYGDTCELTNDLWRVITEGHLSIALGECRRASQLAERYFMTETPETAWLEYLVRRMAFEAHLTSGEVAAAADQLEICEGLGLPAESTGLGALRAHLELSCGNTSEAFALLREIDDARLSFTRKTLMLNFLMAYGTAASAAGHPAESIDAFQRAGVLADRLGVNTSNAAHLRSAYIHRQEDLGLTASERSVLKALVTDKSLAEIAQSLFISQNTLKTHLKRIYKKLDVGGRSEAARKAKSMGITLR